MEEILLCKTLNSYINDPVYENIMERELKIRSNKFENNDSLIHIKEDLLTDIFNLHRQSYDIFEIEDENQLNYYFLNTRRENEILDEDDVRTYDVLKSKLTSIITKILGSNGMYKNMVIAGGFVYSYLFSKLRESQDIDIFFVSEDDNFDFESYLEKILSNLRHYYCGGYNFNISRSSNAITLNIDDNLFGFGSVTKLQFVLKSYKNISQILHSFDIGPCAIGIYDGKIFCTERFVFSLVTRQINIDHRLVSSSYIERLLKYMDRDFAVYSDIAMNICDTPEINFVDDQIYIPETLFLHPNNNIKLSINEYYSYLTKNTIMFKKHVSQLNGALLFLFYTGFINNEYIKLSYKKYFLNKLILKSENSGGYDTNDHKKSESSEKFCVKEGENYGKILMMTYYHKVKKNYCSNIREVEKIFNNIWNGKSSDDTLNNLKIDNIKDKVKFVRDNLELQGSYSSGSFEPIEVTKEEFYLGSY